MSEPILVPASLAKHWENEARHAWSENARLKAEVDNLRKSADINTDKSTHELSRLKAEVEAYAEIKSVLIARNSGLKAEVERLRTSSFVTAVPCEQYERVVKAGDAMQTWLGIIGRRTTCGEIEEWLRAKKGLPSLSEQWEKQKSQGFNFVRPPMPNAAKDGKQP